MKQMQFVRSAIGRDAALRRHRPRISGRNGIARDADHAARCAAERGADGASAPSLPKTARRIAQFNNFRHACANQKLNG